MLRLLLLVLFTTFSSLALANPPTLFTPAEEDVSLVYLGAIFGSQLVPGGSDMHLMSYIFEVFNQVCLSVGLIIVVYTLIVGAMHTAGQGKVLGEKWNSFWIPVRMVMGMALLVPKAGSGYCLAQSIVMWLTIQGIGAADTLWNRVLDYFIDGGAIYSFDNTYSSSYMTRANLDAAYNLERYILQNATCVEAHNRSDNKDVYGEYKIYVTDNYDAVNFGNPKAWDPTDGGGGGRECGYIMMPDIDADTPAEEDLVRQTYNNAFYNMSRGLHDLAEHLADEDGDKGDKWGNYFTLMQSNSVTFIEYLKGAYSILYPNDPIHEDEQRDKLEDLKKYGWVLAGNFYMTLSNFSNELGSLTVDMTVLPDTLIQEPGRDAQNDYAQEITNSKDFWQTSSADPRYSQTFTMWDEQEKYTIPGYPPLLPGSPDPDSNYRLTRQDVETMESSIAGLASMDNGGVWGLLEGIELLDFETKSPVFYLEKIGGFDHEDKIKQNPILHAAKYGKYLTEIAVTMISAAVAFYLGMGLLGMVMGAFGCFAGKFASLTLIIMLFTAPIIFAIAAFLYAQGVMLGVFLPLIPFVVFFVGVLGWFMASIESIVAAPLVALGVIFPENPNEIWGRAEPAYMMILNLFLRPSLMIIGLVVGMVFTWMAVELLNAGFYLFAKDAVQVENLFFGYIVITSAYIGILLFVVGKTFGLINDLPNTVLYWIGDKSQAREGGAEIMNTARSGTKEMGSIVGGGMGMGGSTIEKAAQMMKPDKAQENGKMQAGK